MLQVWSSGKIRALSAIREDKRNAWQGHFARECVATPEEIAAQPAKMPPLALSDIALLHEHLSYLLAPHIPPPFFDSLRAVQDFATFACFVGNDFLPRLPHVDIFTGGVACLDLNFMTC